MSEICRKANILANIDIWTQLHLLRIIGPRPKLHITVLLIKGKPGSQKMKKVRGRRLTKLSREKLVERRAWKLSELKKGKGNIATYFRVEYNICKYFGWRHSNISARVEYNICKYFGWHHSTSIWQEDL